MKNLSKALLPLAGFLLATSFLHAEDPALPPPAHDRAENRDTMRENVRKMAKELNLTADQQTRVEAIHKDTAKSIRALRADASLSEDQKREKTRELREASGEQIRAVLTPEQQVKAKELREERGHRGPGGKHPAGQPPVGEPTVK